MKIRTRLVVLAMLVAATGACFPATAFADGDAKGEIGSRSLEKELHRLEETMEELEVAIERAMDSGQRDTAKQLRATLDALRFVKKQIVGRMEKAEKKRAKQPNGGSAERIKFDLEELKRRREELRERMQDVESAKQEQRNRIKRLRLETPKTVVAKDEHVIIVETDRDGEVTRRLIRSGDGAPGGVVRLGGDIEIDVEELIKRRRSGDRKLQDKMKDFIKRGRDGRRGRDGAAGGEHSDLAHRVERLQRHVEELSKGLHHLQRRVEELQHANKKLHKHLQDAREPRRAKAPTPPKPPQAPGVRMRMGGAGGMDGGQADGRLARIEELLKKLLELQIMQAKAR